MSASACKKKWGQCDHTALPEHIAINSCVRNTTTIAQPHDGGAMFDAVNNQAVILFHLNIPRDGVLFFKLEGGELGKPHTEALQYFLTKTDGWCHSTKLIAPTFLPENSLLVMGGWCQAVLLHGSIDHASLMSSDVHNAAWREAFTVDDYYPVYPLNAKMKAHADEVLKRYQQSKKHPTADRPRTVCTCRYVVVHNLAA